MRARRSWLRRYSLVIAAYILVTLITVPFYMGDTVGYASAIVRKDFSDFGHFLWFPVGWLVSRILHPVTEVFVGQSAISNVVLSLVILNWLAGLLSVLMVQAISLHLTEQERTANLVTLAFILSQAFLCLTQSGCSYIPGLAFLLTGIYLLIKNADEPARSWQTSIAAGACLAVSIGFWFTYVCSIPAALAAPVVLYGFTKERIRLVIQTTAALSVAAILIFGAGAAAKGVRSAEDMKQWVGSSAHGITGLNSVPRMVFGLARSFINMGNDGVLFKAYLSRDPFNPVTRSDLVRTSLAKLALFYLFLGAIVINLLRSDMGRRILALLALNALPVLALALLWEGGAIERYLLLFPLVFIAFAYTLASRTSMAAPKYVSLAFVAIMAVANLGAMAKPVQDKREQAVVERIQDLQPLLKPESVVATVTQQDEVWAFSWTFPFNPINRSGVLNTYHIIEPSTSQVLTWRESFAAQALSAWDKGGDVWVSRRVLSTRPEREWNWVEGADKHVSWKDVNGFFSQIEVGNLVGGRDGFLMVLPSDENRAMLMKVAHDKKREDVALVIPEGV